MDELDFAFRTSKYILGSLFVIGTVAWRYYDKEMANLKDKLLAWGETKIIEHRAIADTKLSDALKLQSDHFVDLVGEAHRRIDRVSAESSTINRAVEVDMALLKHKADTSEQSFLKMEARMEKMGAKIDGMVDTIDRAYREIMKVSAQMTRDKYNDE